MIVTAVLTSIVCTYLVLIPIYNLSHVDTNTKLHGMAYNKLWWEIFNFMITMAGIFIIPTIIICVLYDYVYAKIMQMTNPQRNYNK